MNISNIQDRLTLALNLQKSTKYKQAIKIYQEAIKILPEFVELYIAIAECYEKLLDYEKSIRYYKKAIKLNPNLIDSRANLATLYDKINNYKKAKKEFKKLIKENPNNIMLLNNYASMLKDNQRYKQSIKYYKKAIKLDSKFISAHYNLSIVYFLLNDYKRGFKEYEYRLLQENFINHFQGFENRWSNQNIDNKTLLIVSEQGLGDNIQFIRYTKLLKQIYPKSQIIVLSYKPLSRLFGLIPEIDKIITPQDIIPKYDYFVPIMSLGKILKIRVNNIFAQNGYMNIEDDKYKYLAKDKKSKIGIVYSGSKADCADREINLQSFEPILNLHKNISFYSFQVGDETKQLNSYKFIQDLGSDFGDFYDTASAIKYMDLIISIDTSVVHLAGALDIPCYVLVSTKTGYFWGTKSQKTVWYNSVEIFRQKDYSWTKPINDIQKRLIDYV